VYDVTTANHRFAAGVGRLVVHNTDSVMCIFNCGPENRTNLRAHFEVAERVAAQITASFQKPNELEFEKCYFPYLLFSKKRYAGMLYTTPDAPDSMDVKGLQLVRRDNAPIVKTVSSDILHSIMRDTSRDLAVDVATRHIRMLLANQHALEAYITSKALRSEYKNPDSQPHLQVALKIHQRRGYPVPSGERVPYVFIESKDAPDGLQAQRAEDPAWVAEHGLTIDRLHYLDSQLAGPIETLLDVLQPGTFAELMQSAEIKPLVDELRAARADAIATARRVRTNTTNKQREITSYFIQ
jgi:DNA polymerase delta subunit 1